MEPPPRGVSETRGGGGGASAGPGATRALAADPAAVPHPDARGQPEPSLRRPATGFGSRNLASSDCGSKVGCAASAGLTDYLLFLNRVAVSSTFTSTGRTVFASLPPLPGAHQFPERSWMGQKCGLVAKPLPSVHKTWIFRIIAKRKPHKI